MDQPIVYMGTPSFAVPTLQAFITAGWPIRGVVCQPDRPAGRGQKLTPPPVKELAVAHGLPVFQPEKVKNNPEFLDTLRELNPALIVVVAYGKILPLEILTLPTYGCVNVHASLLPKYRGAAPIQWSIIEGDAVTGVTLMQMDIGMDTGAMLAKAELPILPEDTAVTLAPKLSNLGAELALDQIPRYLAGQIQPQAQDDTLATMAPMLSKETGRLDWRRPARALHNLVRGVQPWPGATTTLLGETLKVIATEVIDGPAEGQPGELMAITPQGWRVATGEGQLLLTQVQSPNKPPRPAADVARGMRDLAVGVTLGEMAGTTGG
jgi:methionyl-tRNA formyltransferase